MVTDLDAIARSAATWIGRQETATDEVSLTLARRLAATLDHPAGGLQAGDALPDGWYVILFPPLEPTGALAADGHPAKGEFLPDLPLPRRMAAARRVVFHQPLRIGETATRISRIAAIEPKQGRSGALAFVTVVHDIAGERGPALTEEQTIVYREEARTAGAPAARPEPAAKDCDWSVTAEPTAALLFRYSAVTFNAHRIHYDAGYVKNREGYPERVVNGGLTAILLLDAARRKHGGPLAEFGIRNVRPLFVDRPITFRGRDVRRGDGRPGTEIVAADADGQVASRAELAWRSEA